MQLPFLNVVTIKDKAFFTGQLSTMINSGLPLTRSLEILATQSRKPALKDILKEVTADLEEGVSFSKSISKHPAVFDNVFISIIRSGETSGKLDQVLKELATQLENENRFISRLRGAMLYPVFILCAMIGVAILMMVKVIPQISQIFKESNAPMPWATKALIAASNVLIHQWWVVILVIIGLVLFLRYYFKTTGGQLVYNNIQIHFPLIKVVSEDIYMSRLTRTLAMLVGSGVEIIKAVNITSEVMNNLVYQKGLKEVSSQIERGIPMSVPLSKNPIFPILLSQMVAVGEQTGKLDEVLRNLANYYQEESDARMRSLTALVEPIIIMIIGAGVGLMVFAILMPIYNIAQIQ